MSQINDPATGLSDRKQGTQQIRKRGRRKPWRAVIIAGSSLVLVLAAVLCVRALLHKDSMNGTGDVSGMQTVETGSNGKVETQNAGEGTQNNNTGIQNSDTTETADTPQLEGIANFQIASAYDTDYNMFDWAIAQAPDWAGHRLVNTEWDGGSRLIESTFEYDGDSTLPSRISVMDYSGDELFREMEYEYTYDSEGRCTEITEWQTMDGETEETHTVLSHNSAGQIETITIERREGEEEGHYSYQYEYGQDGKLTGVEIENYNVYGEDDWDDEIVTETIDYDMDNQAIEISLSEMVDGLYRAGSETEVYTDTCELLGDGTVSYNGFRMNCQFDGRFRCCCITNRGGTRMHNMGCGGDCSFDGTHCDYYLCDACGYEIFHIAWLWSAYQSSPICQYDEDGYLIKTQMDDDTVCFTYES